MDGAQALCLYSAVRLKLWQVGGRRGHDEAFGVSLGETVASADLGGIANMQMRTLKIKVEKGSMWTAVGHGLVNPKR